MDNDLELRTQPQVDLQPRVVRVLGTVGGEDLFPRGLRLDRDGQTATAELTPAHRCFN